MSYFAAAGIVDQQTGKHVGVSQQRNLKTTSPVRLVGTTLNVLDTNFWTTVVNLSGTVSAANGETTCAVPVTSGAFAVLMSNRIARYVSGATNIYRSTKRLNVVSVVNNSRFCGVTDAALATGQFQNGFGFLLVGGTFSVVAYNGATLGLIPTSGGTITKVDSGAFNGPGGSSYALDAYEHLFEIHYSNKSVYFFIDDVLIHTMTTSQLPLSGTLHLRVTSITQNTGTITGTAQLKTMNAVVNRLGYIITQPTSKYQTGVTGSIFKTGAGNIHALVVGTVPTTGAVVTLYDGTTTGGTVLGVFTFAFPGGGNFSPVSIDLKGLTFSSGLYVDTTAQSANITVIYE